MGLKGEQVATQLVPYTPAELTAILMACDRIGKRQYELLRACALILSFRYTALRIGDVAFLAKDRISRDGDRWRIFLRTENSGQSVFLPVPPDLKAALDTVPAPMTNMVSRYFFWNGTGKPETHKGHMHRLLKAIFTASGVKGAHPRRFRHTLATHYWAAVPRSRRSPRSWGTVRQLCANIKGKENIQ